jgi:hypothetical protein
VAASRQVSEQERANARYYIYEALRVLSEQFQKPDEPFSFYPQGQVNRMKQCLEQFTNSPFTRNRNDAEMVGIWEKVCEPLIEKKNALTLSLWDIGSRANRVIPPGGSIDAAKRWYKLLERVSEILQTQSSNKQVMAALDRIRDSQAEMRKRLPQLDVDSKVQSLPVRMLLTQDEWMHQIRVSVNMVRAEGGRGGASGSIRPIRFSKCEVNLQELILWIAFIENNSSGNRIDVGLVGIDLEKMKQMALWQAEVPSPLFSHLTGLSINKDTIYLSVSSIGIIAFPGSLVEGREFFRDPNDAPVSLSYLSPRIRESLKIEENNKQKYSRKPTIYTQKDSLPSLSITSIAQDADKLWVAYGGSGQESGLGLYDPKTVKWETIFCSTLKDNPPFSAGQPYQISNLIFEPPNTFIFLVRHSQSEYSGLWKVDTTTRRTKFIGPLSGGELTKDFKNKVWFKTPSYLIEFDSDHEQIKFVTGNIQTLNSEYSHRNLSPSDIKMDFFITESTVKDILFGTLAGGRCDLSTSTIHDNKLWARMGQSQILIAEKGKSFEDALIIDNNLLDGGPVSRFVSTPYGLIAIGDGTVGLIETGDNSK